MSKPIPSAGRTLSVLHVDDDPMNLRVVEEILSAFGHHSVKAASGSEALAHLGQQNFDVVLMDIHMPGMSGVEVVERLRASKGPERDVAVIALSADLITRRPEEYLALGFTAFVAKPIAVAGLIAAIVRAATAKAMPASAKVRRTA